MAAGDVYSAVFPTDLGAYLSSVTVGLNQGNNQGFQDWWANTASPMFAALVKAGMSPLAAIQIVLADGMPKPSQIAAFTFKVNGSSSSLVNTGSDNKIGGSIGFLPTGIPILAGLQASITGSTEQTQTSQQASQADSSMELDIVPVNTASMLAALTQAATVLNTLTALPALIPVPTTTGGSAGGGTTIATAKS